jgi:hypothetical protein
MFVSTVAVAQYNWTRASTKTSGGVCEGYFVVVPLNPPGLDLALAQTSRLLITAQCFIRIERVAAIAHNGEGSV